MIGTLGTVNEDGSPHVSPVFLAYNTTKDPGLNFMWSSRQTAAHSQNIERTGQGFIVIFDSVTARGGGLYAQVSVRAIPPNDATFENTYQTFAARKTQFSLPVSSVHNYQNGTQTLYLATAQSIWVNISRKDENGVVMGDERIQITVPQVTEYLS